MVLWILVAMRLTVSAGLWLGDVAPHVPDSHPRPVRALAADAVTRVEHDAVRMAAILTSQTVTKPSGIGLTSSAADVRAPATGTGPRLRVEPVTQLGASSPSIAAVPQLEFVAPRPFETTRVTLSFVLGQR